MITDLELTRLQILAFRRRVAALDERLPRSRQALRRAAWAGLQDSMPRAALLSIHARMTGTESGSWEDPSLVQVWGPRFSAYVVAKRDLIQPVELDFPVPGDETEYWFAKMIRQLKGEFADMNIANTEGT